MSAQETVPFTLVQAAELAGSAGRVLLLDVRTPAEFAAVHIPGAVLQPLTELDIKTVQQLAQGKERCVVICRSGGRARQAAQRLAASIPNLAVLEGGVTAWETAGLPLERGAGVISLERQVRIAAGALVVAGVILGAAVHPLWYGLSGFVGVGLIFAGVTDTCGMAMLLAHMPWNTRCATSAQSCAIK